MLNEKDVYTLVDEQISNDSEFQTSLESMDDSEKETAISDKKTKLVKARFAKQGEDLKKTKKAYDSTKIRAEKAEAAAKKAKDNKSPENKQPDATDYGKLAYLRSKGVKHPDDVKVVTEEAERLKLPIEEILGMTHIKGKLKDAKDQREAELGMPESKGGKSVGNKGSVEYWLNRKDKDGNFLTPTDLKLANKVIDARLKSQTENDQFSDETHTG